MKARSAKAKGTRLERWVVDKLVSCGIKARKQPGSGIYQDFPHDVEIQLPNRTRLIVECKSWKNGWLTGDRAMGKADLLVIRKDRGEPNCYMKWEVFLYLMHTAHEYFSILEHAREEQIDDTSALVGVIKGEVDERPD